MAKQDYFLSKANEFFEKAKGEANREKRIAFENIAQGYLRMAEQAIRGPIENLPKKAGKA
jgi:hypothetical protein